MDREGGGWAVWRWLRGGGDGFSDVVFFTDEFSFRKRRWEHVGRGGGLFIDFGGGEILSLHGAVGLRLEGLGWVNRVVVTIRCRGGSVLLGVVRGNGGRGGGGEGGGGGGGGSG